MTRLVLILLLGLVFEAVGVVLLSRALKETRAAAGPDAPRAALVVRCLRSPVLWAGVACEAVFFGTLVYLLSRGDVSLIWPLTSLGLVLTTLAARCLLHEQVSPLRWVGVGLIVLGSALVIQGGRPPPANPPAAPAPP
jgi:drug/metabolite transporter (DMT)-like permease